MSDTISTAFCDLSEISCHWGLRYSLFNSAGDCHVPNTLVTVSSCLGAWEMFWNKWAQVSSVRGLHQKGLRQCRGLVYTLGMQWTCEHTLGWHRALPKRMKPNRIYITCDIHMMAPNWFVMPDFSVMAATKAGAAPVVALLEPVILADACCLQRLAVEEA